MVVSVFVGCVPLGLYMCVCMWVCEKEMEDPRKETCVENDHLYDRLSLDCFNCSVKGVCWSYTGLVKYGAEPGMEG